MRDLLGHEIHAGDAVVYGNDSGFLALAMVTTVNENSLTILKRSYRGSIIERTLTIPRNTIVVTKSLQLADLSDCFNPEEVDQIRDLVNNFNP